MSRRTPELAIGNKNPVADQGALKAHPEVVMAWCRALGWKYTLRLRTTDGGAWTGCAPGLSGPRERRSGLEYGSWGEDGVQADGDDDFAQLPVVHDDEEGERTINMIKNTIIPTTTDTDLADLQVGVNTIADMLMAEAADPDDAEVRAGRWCMNAPSSARDASSGSQAAMLLPCLEERCVPWLRGSPAG